MHGHMARGGHGLPKVSFGSAMPYPSTPCGQNTPGVGRLQGGWPTAVSYPFGHPMLYAYGSFRFIFGIGFCATDVIVSTVALWARGGSYRDEMRQATSWFHSEIRSCDWVMDICSYPV
jgi:hypothetical protein